MSATEESMSGSSSTTSMGPLRSDNAISCWLSLSSAHPFGLGCCGDWQGGKDHMKGTSGVMLSNVIIDGLIVVVGFIAPAKRDAFAVDRIAQVARMVPVTPVCKPGGM